MCGGAYGVQRGTGSGHAAHGRGCQCPLRAVDARRSVLPKTRAHFTRTHFTRTRFRRTHFTRTRFTRTRFTRTRFRRTHFMQAHFTQAHFTSPRSAQAHFTHGSPPRCRRGRCGRGCPGTPSPV
ncbi:pentapeptide repeat-containing protein [Streptomyces sp. NBC_00203]|uniref:pentapeptide repeat-containing protein n=1 Tax=Streptomyces sp. NBC_00203 TaxID=2975680 RepID=UPI003863657B